MLPCLRYSPPVFNFIGLLLIAHAFFVVQSWAGFLETKGLVYLNATRSGQPGEQYFIQQQLSSVQLFSDASWNDWSAMHTVLIYNTTPTVVAPSLYFDEAYVTLKNQWQMNVGRKWLPFGVYKSDLIYKPFTKLLAQTNEYLVEGEVKSEKEYASVAWFRPHTKIVSSSLPLYYHVNLGWREARKKLAYDGGIAYLYSIAESQLFQYNSGWGGYLNRSMVSHVDGLAAYANANYYPYSAHLSYVFALHSFLERELSFNQHGAKPAALSLQGGYAFSVKNIPLKGMLFYDQSFLALGLSLSEKRVGVGLNVNPFRHMDLQFQLFKDQGYRSTQLATGLQKTIRGNAAVTYTAAIQVVLRF